MLGKGVKVEDPVLDRTTNSMNQNDLTSKVSLRPEACVDCAHFDIRSGGFSVDTEVSKVLLPGNSFAYSRHQLGRSRIEVVMLLSSLYIYYMRRQRSHPQLVGGSRWFRAVRLASR